MEELNGWIGDKVRKACLEFQVKISLEGGVSGITIKSMIDVVLVKRDMLRYVQDVR